MTISAIEATHGLSRFADNSVSAAGQADQQDIEAFTQRLLAGSASSPEHQVVNQLQQAQATLMSGLRDSAVVQRLSPENALTAQARLADSVIGVDMVAKVAGSFSTAINKLVSMQ